MSSFQNALELARLTKGLQMNQTYTAALQAKEEVTGKEFQSISEHLINIQAGRIEAYVKKYAPLLGEHAWSSQMIEGLNQALKKTGIEIVEVESGGTKEASHSDFFQRKYIKKFEKSEEFQQVHQTICDLGMQKNQIDAEFADSFGGALDDSILGKIVANKLQNEVAKIVVYIEDLLCGDKSRPLQEDTLKALDFALQINGHELKGINFAKHLDPSSSILLRILDENKTTKTSLNYNAKEDEKARNILDKLAQLIQSCELEGEPGIFNQQALNLMTTSEPLFLEYLQSLTELRIDLTIDKVLERLEQDIVLFNTEEIVRAIEQDEENLQVNALKAFSGNIEFNINHLKPIFVDESDLALVYQLTTISNTQLLIDLESPYEKISEYAWSEVDHLLAGMTLQNGLFDLEAFNSLGINGSIYPLTYKFLTSIIAAFGAAKTITSAQLARAAKAHYKKVLEEAKKQDQIHLEKVRLRKEEAVRAQREIQREQREAVRRRASEESDREGQRRAWFSWLPSMPKFSLFS